MAVSIENKVKHVIINHNKGKLFFPSSFSKYGSSSSIRQALKRLENDDFLVRLAPGIYLYPKLHPTLGVLYPDFEEIAIAIAKRDKARIIPTGIQALNKLGLSTQVPVNTVFLTDGSTRSIKLEQGSIKFKKATPKLLSVKSDKLILIIQALKELGVNNVTPAIKERVREVLETVNDDLIKHDIKLAPHWVAEIIKESANL